ncbi:LysR family transcriptional regulator substrate-binding protein [Streptomyces griseofuscus]|uniref:LysR family transcriptional regulator substrate-binding protein n=1 Tax=Streptomyces griseofuscus TaxID=146922 RepID=UPI0033D6E954
MFVDVPLVVAAVPGHPLMAAYPDGGAVSSAALAGHRLIGLQHVIGMRAVLERLCAGAGFRPQVVFEAAASDALARLAARDLGVGVGVGVLPGPGPHPGLRALTLADPRARARAALVRRAQGPLGPAARELLGRLREELRAGRRMRGRNRAGARVSCAGRRGSRCARR